MFDNYNNTKTINNLKINACSGGIYKTYKESWFKRVHLKSELMESLSNPTRIKYYAEEDDYMIGNHYKKDSYTDYYKKAKPITILQMVICGEMEVIAEIIYTEDLDKHLDKHLGKSND